MKMREMSISVIRIGLLAVLYYLSASFGLRLGAVSGFATLFWLPTGISLVAVYFFGYRMLLGVFLGAAFVNYTFGAPLPVALTIGIGNMLEALTGVYLLKKVSNFSVSLERLSDALGLILLASVFSTLISATIGTTSLATAGLLKNSFSFTWLAWWIGDMVSDLVFASFILVWSKKPVFSFGRLRSLELVFVTILLVFIGLTVFSRVMGVDVKNTTLTYLAFPPLIWLALRFSPREAITGMLFFALVANWGTITGYGPFLGDTMSTSLLSLQSFMIVVSVSVLLLAAVVSERRAFEKRKDDFISFASHELKTPITSMKLFARMLQKELRHSNPKTRQYLTRLDFQLDKLSHLVNDMLDLPKVQTGTLEYRKEQFLLPSLIKEVVETMQDPSQENRIIVKKGVSVTVYADKERIGQVLSNLLSNAIKYSPAGSKIIVGAIKRKNNVVVSIRDYGVGIAPDEQKKIFEQFYRVDTPTTHMTSGLGVGLYLASMIVGHHGGAISVKSKLKKGSTFSFTLPLEREGFANLEVTSVGNS